MLDLLGSHAMKRFVVFVACAACGGGAAANGETAPIIVPSQPPQPSATSVAATNANADASAPVAQKAFECKTGQRFESAARAFCAYTEALPWDAAEHRCVENGGHLATIESQPALNAMRSVLGSPVALPRAAWIGVEMKKTGAKKEWRWSNGAAMTAPAWSAGEPNDFYGDGTEACGEWLVSDGKWNDTRCNLALPFLCQMGKAPLSCSPSLYTTLLDGKYCLAKNATTHADAKKQCAAQSGAALAGPISESENEVLRKAIAARFSAPRFWIGLNDIAEEGTWRWASGASFDFDAWHGGEPNDHLKEDCVEVYADTWTWNDFDCAAAKPFVCESPKRK
jgi:hypothetical protein